MADGVRIRSHGETTEISVKVQVNEDGGSGNSVENPEDLPKVRSLEPAFLETPRGASPAPGVAALCRFTSNMYEAITLLSKAPNRVSSDTIDRRNFT